jgi:hypothetical protein
MPKTVMCHTNLEIQNAKFVTGICRAVIRNTVMCQKNLAVMRNNVMCQRNFGIQNAVCQRNLESCNAKY